MMVTLRFHLAVEGSLRDPKTNVINIKSVEIIGDDHEVLYVTTPRGPTAAVSTSRAYKTSNDCGGT